MPTTQRRLPSQQVVVRTRKGTSEDVLIDCAIAVLTLISNRTDPIAISAHVGAERALAGAGALAHFYEDVAIKIPPLTAPVPPQ